MHTKVSILALARIFFVAFVVTLGAVDLAARVVFGGGIVGPTRPVLAAPSVEPIVPVRLVIESLAIDAIVEHVGKNKNGNMAVPSSYRSTAWYSLGSRPGARGNAVIDGHRDNSLGLPGVFAHLEDIGVGDEIVVADAEGKNLTFTVTRRERYSYEEAPLESIFATDGDPQLVLITCDGDWNSTARSYAERLVVYASLDS